MLRFFIFLCFFQYTSNVIAGWFGPDDPDECFTKYKDETYFLLGKRIIKSACFHGYGESQDDIKQVAKCILSDADDLSSRDSSYKIIDKCAKKYNSHRGYIIFTNPLQADEQDLIDRIDELEDRLNQ
jgi:hypothetical protein